MVYDHGSMEADLEEIAISKFKATCLAVLEKVRKTGKVVVVTRFGKPVAEVVPPHASRRQKHWVGSRAGTGQILGDIISPASDESDWDALRG
jgi:prevent-host-death family protein